MKLPSLALALMLCGFAASAQTATTFTTNETIRSADINNAFKSKADAANGVVTTPAINGGTVTGAIITGGSVGAANGIAALDSTVRIPAAELPTIALTSNQEAIAGGLATLDANGLVTANQQPFMVQSLINPIYLPHWGVARAKVEAQIANARVVYMSDSTGFGANAAGTVFPQNVTYWLASLLNDPAHNLYFNQNSFCGFSTQTQPGSRLNGDPEGRVAGGSWGLLNPSAVATLGGSIAYSQAAGAPFVYSPGTYAGPNTAVDTFNLFYNQYAAAGTLTGTASLTATGGTAVTANSYGATDVTYGTATSPSAASGNTLTVNYSGQGSGSAGNGQFNILCVEAYNSAQKSVNIFNGSFYGATSSAAIGLGLASQPYDPLPMLQALQPALVIVELDINDWTFNTVNATQHRANLQAIDTAAQAVGADMLFVTGTPNDINTGAEASIVGATRTLAANDNIPLVDINQLFVTWDAANALGLMSDAKHPNTLGNFDEAYAIVKALQ